MKAKNVRLILGLGVMGAAMPARADTAPPPGFVEPIMQWGVQKGETCEDIAKALYGSATHVPLIGRYNRVVCAAGKPLPEGMTLILPKKVTNVPDAQVKSSHPDVRGRPSGGSWSIVSSGAPLYRNHNLQTMDEGRAHIEFLDHTHVFLAQNTLIVVYGTANKTKVSKVAPTVELQSGEVQAGLSALRGEPAIVAVPEGGLVSAQSRDTVVERKANRTTVAVFEGKCNVESGGKTVVVPKDFGTRFAGNAPPAPPRPLPPAPVWQSGGSPSILLAPLGTAVLTTNWSTVDKAKAYRFEVSRDEGFHDLVVREEIGANINSFRAEKFPPGTYRLRVRAIDAEEYLGIASEIRIIEVVAAEIHGEGSRLEGGRVIANPYGMLKFDTQSGLSLSLDEGPFGNIPSEIDLLRQSPKNMRIRTAAGKIENIVVEYTQVKANPIPSFDPEKRISTVRISFEGAKDIDIGRRISPTLRVHIGERSETIALEVAPDKSFLGSIAVGDAAGEMRLDVTDDKGRLLGSNSIVIPEKPKPVDAIPRPVRQLGLKLSSPRPAAATGVPWWTPTAPMAAGVGIAAGVTARGPVLQGNLRASGSLGRWGFDALVESPALEDDDGPRKSPDAPPAENTAWLGVRHRLIRSGDAELEFGPALRVGLPMVMQGQPFRFDAGLALGGSANSKWTWLVNAGGVFALSDEMSRVPRFAPYVLAGGTYDVANWMRAYAVADVHWMIMRDKRDVFPFGLSAGFEVGRNYFAALGGWVGRAESFESKWGAVGMLSFGIHTVEVTR